MFFSPQLILMTWFHSGSVTSIDKVHLSSFSEIIIIIVIIIITIKTNKYSVKISCT